MTSRGQCRDQLNTSTVGSSSSSTLWPDDITFKRVQGFTCADGRQRFLVIELIIKFGRAGGGHGVGVDFDLSL